MKNNIIIEKIRQRSLDVYQHYIGSRYPYGKVQPGKNISNPLISRTQTTPSFRIYKGYDGSYLFIDSADDSCNGDCISFVQKLKGLRRDQAIEEIKKTINLN